MKRTTVHRIKYAFLFLYITLTVVICIIFRDNLTEMSLEPKFLGYIFLGCIFIALIIILLVSIKEILKPNYMIKNEKIKSIENKINYHKNIITDFEKELKDLKELNE